MDSHEAHEKIPTAGRPLPIVVARVQNALPEPPLGHLR